MMEFDDSIYDFSSDAKYALLVSRDSGSVRTSISRLGSPPSRRESVATRPTSSRGNDAFSLASSRWGSQTVRGGADNQYEAVKREEKVLCPREKAEQLEEGINELIDETAILIQQGKHLEALDKAKEAVKEEEELKKFRKDHALGSEGQAELTFAVWFSVASCYQINDLSEDAINAYTLLTKQRGHPLAGRARINLGNLYSSQHDYPSAIRMYKMALDQNQPDDKQVLAHIRCNIGLAYFHQGQLRDAIKNFEESIYAHLNHQAGFNLLVCHLSLGDTVNAKKYWFKLMKIQSSCIDEDDMRLDNDANQRTSQILLSAARLIAPSLGMKELMGALKDGHEQLAMKMEYEYAVNLLKLNDYKHAFKLMKSLEKKSPEMKAMVATNLSFLYFLQGDVDMASEYADIALDKSRYNCPALVNRANCFFVNEDYESAKDLYLEAIGVEADCAQAIFNLGLSNVRSDQPNDAIQAFEKLHSITPNNPMVIYHIADIYENQFCNNIESIKWFNVLAASQSSDSGVLARLAYLYSKVKDQSQSLHYHLESYRHFPVDLDVIAWIGAWFVQQEMFEKSIYFFRQAALVQPKEIKWGLMVASAHRRTGNQTDAFSLYKQLHQQFPENIECLRSLVMLCKSIREPFHMYQEKLEKLMGV